MLIVWVISFLFIVWFDFRFVFLCVSVVVFLFLVLCFKLCLVSYFFFLVKYWVLCLRFVFVGDMFLCDLLKGGVVKNNILFELLCWNCCCNFGVSILFMLLGNVYILGGCGGLYMLVCGGLLLGVCCIGGCVIGVDIWW